MQAVFRPGSVHRIVAALLATAAIGACATLDASRPAKVDGGILTDPAGMTLYGFDRDPVGSGRSACNGPCAADRPPFVALPTAIPTRDWTIVVRDDGTRQWAFRGRPLYTFAKDHAPGERNGDGLVDPAWHVVRP